MPATNEGLEIDICKDNHCHFKTATQWPFIQKCKLSISRSMMSLLSKLDILRAWKLSYLQMEPLMQVWTVGLGRQVVLSS